MSAAAEPLVQGEAPAAAPAAAPPPQAQMEDPSKPTDEELDSLPEMTPEDVAKYFEKRGFGEHGDVWVNHRVNGQRVILLTVQDVKDLGITSIGDRMGIQRELDLLRLAATRKMRNNTIAQHKEAYDGSDCEKAFYTCFGLFPRDEDTYTLTASSLRLQEYKVPRICGTWKCTCLGSATSTDNISLDQIRDVDTLITKKGLCCFAVDKAKLMIAVAAGNDSESAEARVTQKDIFVEGPVGEEFSNQIFLAIEEYKSAFKQAKKLQQKL